MCPLTVFMSSLADVWELDLWDSRLHCSRVHRYAQGVCACVGKGMGEKETLVSVLLRIPLM